MTATTRRDGFVRQRKPITMCLHNDRRTRIRHRVRRIIVLTRFRYYYVRRWQMSEREPRVRTISHIVMLL